MYFSLYGKLSTLFISFRTEERERGREEEREGKQNKNEQANTGRIKKWPCCCNFLYAFALSHVPCPMFVLLPSPPSSPLCTIAGTYSSLPCPALRCTAPCCRQPSVRFLSGLDDQLGFVPAALQTSSPPAGPAHLCLISGSSHLVLLLLLVLLLPFFGPAL